VGARFGPPAVNPEKEIEAGEPEDQREAGSIDRRDAVGKRVLAAAVMGKLVLGVGTEHKMGKMYAMEIERAPG